MSRGNFLSCFGLLAAAVMFSACSTQQEECARIMDIAVKDAAEVASLDAAVKSSETAVVAIAAGKGEANTSVALERLSKVVVETPAVQVQYKDILGTLKDLTGEFAAIKRDLSAKSAMEKPLSDAGRAHATNVTKLRMFCEKDQKAKAACEKVSAILKEFPVDTGQNPALFRSKLAELKALKVEHAGLVPIVTDHVAVLEVLGPKLIEARAIEDRVAAAQDRAALLSGSYQRKMESFEQFCAAP